MYIYIYIYIWLGLVHQGVVGWMGVGGRGGYTRDTLV